MTEDEARQKWCPMVRAISPNGTIGPCNRRADANDKEYFCIASDCMMWIATDNECEPQESHEGGTATVIFEPKCYPAGYCGLAGKP